MPLVSNLHTQPTISPLGALPVSVMHSEWLSLFLLYPIQTLIIHDIHHFSCKPWVTCPLSRVSHPHHYWHFGEIILCCGLCPAYYRMFSSTLHLYQLHVNTNSPQLGASKMSEDIVKFPWYKIPPRLRSTVLHCELLSTYSQCPAYKWGQIKGI